MTVYLRWEGDGHQSVGGSVRRGAVQSRHASVDVAVQLIVQVEVALVLQWGAASGTLETLNMEIFILNSHKHSTNDDLFKSFFVRNGMEEKSDFN